MPAKHIHTATARNTFAGPLPAQQGPQKKRKKKKKKNLALAKDWQELETMYNFQKPKGLNQ
jgi:hypothetical protein